MQHVKLSVADFLQVSRRSVEEFRADLSEQSRLPYGDVAVLVLQRLVETTMLSDGELLNLTQQVMYARYLELEKLTNDRDQTIQ